MIIGVPKEIKNNENRVGLTPAGVAEFKKAGHQVYVQTSAGTGSGFTLAAGVYQPGSVLARQTDLAGNAGPTGALVGQQTGGSIAHVYFVRI